MVDLLERIRLGQNALLGGLDPTQGHLPYWNCGIKNGDPIKVTSSVGEFTTSAYVTEGIVPGVIAVSHSLGREHSGAPRRGQAVSRDGSGRASRAVTSSALRERRRGRRA